MADRPVVRTVIVFAVLALVVLACSPGPNQTPSPSSAAPASPTAAATTARASGGSSPGPAGTATQSASSASGASPSPSFFVYAVVRGDSLLSIARRYGTSGRSIAYWNRDTYPSLDPDSKDYSPNRIEIGWKLKLIPNVTLDDQVTTPSRRPTPIPIPSGSRPPAPTPPADGSALLLSNGSRDLHEVALTFDLGSELAPTVDVITWLIDNDVPATMFVEGQTATTTDDGRKALGLIAAHPDLFAVGNGSWDGTAYTELTADQIAEQLTLAENAIFTATGRSTKPFFRPPFGAQDGHVRAAAGAMGWPYMVMWDVDTLDAKSPSEGGPTAGDIVAKVLSRAQGGSIVRLHVGGYNTLEALPGIVDGLRARGLEPVSLSAMFGF